MRVLIPTSRTFYSLVSYGMVLDFEDAVAAQSDADLVPVPPYTRRDHLRLISRGNRLASVIPPGDHYDVCFLVAMGSFWIPSLRFINRLRERAGRVAVYLYDSWVSDLPKLQAAGRVWEQIDDLFVSFPHAVVPYSEGLPCRVHYLPQATEPRWFSPYRSERPIDVLSIGRRLPAAHEALLDITRERDLFYFYQTHRAPEAINLRENQELLGRLCQSSRVHVSWAVNRTYAHRASEGHSAITARWFESAACGAIVLGSAPASPAFAELFHIPNFVYEIGGVNPDRAEVEATLDAALADDATQARRELAEEVRSRHTWAERWRSIVELLQL